MLHCDTIEHTIVLDIPHDISFQILHNAHLKEIYHFLDSHAHLRIFWESSDVWDLGVTFQDCCGWDHGVLQRTSDTHETSCSARTPGMTLNRGERLGQGLLTVTPVLRKMAICRNHAKMILGGIESKNATNKTKAKI